MRKDSITDLGLPLTPNQDRALQCILGAAQAWCPVRKLERARHTGDTLRSLQALGWLVLWDRDRWGNPLSYPSWTLTPWAAIQLGVRICHRRGIPVWSTAAGDHAEADVAHIGRRERDRLRYPDLVADGAQARRRPPRYVRSYYWGELTDDPAEAELVLGVPVELVPAL